MALDLGMREKVNFVYVLYLLVPEQLNEKKPCVKSWPRPSAN